MYKLLLCLRYLRTRYIALASIISVTLGVATMIVVNSVMAGFGTEMRDRIHGLLADIVIETHTIDGQPDPDQMLADAKAAAGDDIAGMTATVELQPLIDELTASPASDCGTPAYPDVRLTPEQARFPLVDTAGDERGVLILTSLVADRRGDTGTEPLRVRHVEALAVVH